MKEKFVSDIMIFLVEVFIKEMEILGKEKVSKEEFLNKKILNKREFLNGDLIFNFISHLSL